MPVEASSDGKTITLKHPKGASATVLLFGATVISWKCRTSSQPDSTPPQERLFLSSKAILDGSKAVRGGIPVVFPFFGPATKEEHISAKLPQHGYARSEWWTWDGGAVMDNEAGVSVSLAFSPGLSLTSDQVHLSYTITISEHQLSTNLHVTNTSNSPGTPLSFQALLHTYIRVPSAPIVKIFNLTGLTYTDKTAPGTPRKIEEREGVDVQKFTDAVYENAPGEYVVRWAPPYSNSTESGGGGVKVKSIGMKDVVVWNPRAEAGSKMGDMEEGGWDHFVCLEPGYVAGWATVQPGEKWIGGQTITVLD